MAKKPFQLLASGGKLWNANVVFVLFISLEPYRVIVCGAQTFSILDEIKPYSLIL